MWALEKLNPYGVLPYADPSRLIFGKARTALDQLWAAEEALRSGLVPLVVVELADPPGLVPVRRLHLAAREGASRGTSPLALILTPGGSAPGVETRWHLAPAPDNAWTLTRQRARAAPEKSWAMRISEGCMRLAPLPG